jgi:hypothetical protein
MLENLPIAKENLIRNGAEMHIIGRNQVTSDLPELASQKGVKYKDNGIMTDIDTRTRGVGGLFASCGEENLLNLPGDRYSDGNDICIHEFAHTLMDYGLDSTLRFKINQFFERAKGSGIWKNAYAVSNGSEYWAELSTWYFGGNGEFVPGTRLPHPGPAGLQAFDPVGYSLLDSIYQGKLQPKSQKRQTVMAYKGASSAPSNEPVTFRFSNVKSTPVKVYWVDYGGNEKLFATVQPQAHINPETFTGHIWKFEYADRKTEIYVRIYANPTIIELKD